MEAGEYFKLATDKTEAGDLIKENNLTEAIIKMLDNYAEIRVKNCSIPDVSTRTKMRKQAITVFELTKGFTGEPTDNAMKTALEMADYVMRLTNDL